MSLPANFAFSFCSICHCERSEAISRLGDCFDGLSMTQNIYSYLYYATANAVKQYVIANSVKQSQDFAIASMGSQ